MQKTQKEETVTKALDHLQDYLHLQDLISEQLSKAWLAMVKAQLFDPLPKAFQTLKTFSPSCHVTHQSQPPVWLFEIAWTQDPATTAPPGFRQAVELMVQAVNKTLCMDSLLSNRSDSCTGSLVLH